MSSLSTRRLAELAILSTLLPVAAARAGGGGQETETAYRNFPEVPSGWFVTGCCEGATIADDIQVAPGTEGMRLASIQLRLYSHTNPVDFVLHILAHDDETGLPGVPLGSQFLETVPGGGYTELTVDVCNLDVRIPASGRLWIAIYSPIGTAGWNVADAEPIVGTSENSCARDAAGDEAGFTLMEPWEEIEFLNLMLSVEVAPDPCPADVNGDNTVDVEDMVAVILDWGCSDPPGPCPADVNADGVVNVDDLVAVVLAWGSCFDF